MLFNRKNDLTLCEKAKSKKMIFGIGTDITENKRIESVLGKHPSFTDKYFNAEEYESYTHLPKEQFAQKIAKLYAGKEAFFKALGTGLRFNMSFKDITILKNELGKPYIKISGKTLNYIEKNIALMEKLNIHISLSDEQTHSIAFVVIEK